MKTSKNTESTTNSPGAINETTSVVSGVVPYIDLREVPFSVVANDSSPAVVAQNTVWINLAIATYSGTEANLFYLMATFSLRSKPREERISGGVSSLAQASRS